MSSAFLQIRRNNRTGQRMVFRRYGSNNRNIVARQKVRNAVSAGVAGVSALVKRLGKSKFFSGKGKPPRKLLAGRSKAYTADPTNRVPTASSGGMTTHSMTVSIGSRKSMTQKLVKDSKESVIYRFGAIQPFNNVTVSSSGLSPAALVGGGAYPLVNLNTLAAGGTGAFTQYMPLYVADLTSCLNYISGAAAASVPFRQLKFTGTCTVAGTYPVNSVDFHDINGRDTNGTTATSTWVVEKSASGATSSSTYPMASCIQEWSQIKLLCYGAMSRSTRFKIEIVQIKDDDFHPYEISQLSATAPISTVFDDFGAAVNFWQGISASSYKHPIASISTDYRKNVKVIKEYDFIIDPTTTIEERADVGHTKLLNIFIPMYRRNNYATLNGALETNLADQDNIPVELGKPEVYLKPRARIYMIIQATNPTTLNDGTPVPYNVANTPSFDMVIRNKFSQLS